MKIYQVCLFVWFCCSASSKPNGFNSPQPSSKWAIAHSYSWVIEPRTFEPISLSHQTEEQQIQQGLQRARHQALLQEQAQQQTLQQTLQQSQQNALQQAQQNALQQAQQYALQQAQQLYALQTIQRQAQQPRLEQVQQQPRLERVQQHSLQYVPPNQYNGRGFNNLQNEYVTSSTPSRMNEITYPHMRNYNQEFVDAIVEKVIQKTGRISNLGLPTTKKGDIEKVVRDILFEYSLNNRDANGRNLNQNYENFPNNQRVMNGNYLNQNNFPQYSEVYNPQNAKSIAIYPTPTEPLHSQVDCIFNCGNSQNSYSSGEPIAIAFANALTAPNRSTDPRILANSFTYTSV